MNRKLAFIFLSALTLSACAIAPAQRLVTAKEKVEAGPSLEKIADDVWIHKSYEYIEPWGLILSQGLVVKNDKSILIIDTAWNDNDTERLLNLVEQQVSDQTGSLVPTHAHNDKMGGIRAANERDWKTVAFKLTNEDAGARGLTPAQNSFAASDDTHDAARGWTIGRVKFFYPGPGHTRDNIVAYDPKTKILFGGCLIRPGGTNNLGNTADADLASWADTVRRVATEFPEAEIIIPSHGPAGGRELLDHTIALAEAARTALSDQL